MTARRLILGAVLGLGVLLLLGWQLLQFATPLEAPITVDTAFEHEPLVAWGERADLVVDDRAGFRARPQHTAIERVAPLDAPEQFAPIEHVTDAQGLVRATPLPNPLPGPRVLVLGDDLTAGGVPIDMLWPARLEATLRTSHDHLHTTQVLNAACNDYGPLHHVLRGPPLVARYAPRLVIVALSTGDDLTALDDRHLVHLDETLFVAAPAFAPTTDPLALTARAQQLAPTLVALVRRGLAPAAYLQQMPERRALLDRKLRQCVGWLRELAPRSGLLVVLLPPAELARPAAVHAACSADGAALLAGDGLAATHTQFVQALTDRGVPYVDMLPALTAATAPDVYRADGRLGSAGHALVEQALAARVRGFLVRR